MVCSWTWTRHDALDQAKDILRRWEYRQPSSIEWIDMPALCNWVIGVSSASLVPWNVAYTVACALGDIILAQIPVKTAVELRIGMNHSVMKGTGLVVGSVSKAGEPEYCFYARGYIATNLFGLQFPSNCPICGYRTYCDSQSSASADCLRVPQRITCSNCKRFTQWFTPPKCATVDLDPDLYSWKLPLVEQAWSWMEPKAETANDVITLAY